MDSCPGASREETDIMLTRLIRNLRAHPALKNAVFVLLIESNFDEINQSTYYTSLSQLRAMRPMYNYRGTKRGGYGVVTTNRTKNSGVTRAWDCMMEAQVWFATGCVGPIEDRMEEGVAGMLYTRGLRTRLLKQLAAMRRIQTQATELSSSSRHAISGKGVNGTERDDFAMAFIIAVYFAYVLQQEAEFVEFCKSEGCEPELALGGFHGSPADSN